MSVSIPSRLAGCDVARGGRAPPGKIIGPPWQNSKLDCMVKHQPRAFFLVKTRALNFSSLKSHGFYGSIKMVLLCMVSARPSSLLGKQSKSGNIRFTVGQYWLIIKKNGTNYDNFERNCVNYVGNFVIAGEFVLCSEKFWYAEKIFLGPKFFWRRGGEGGRQKKYSPEKKLRWPPLIFLGPP